MSGFSARCVEVKVKSANTGESGAGRIKPSSFRPSGPVVSGNYDDIGHADRSFFPSKRPGRSFLDGSVVMFRGENRLESRLRYFRSTTPPPEPSSHPKSP